jgi:hypothetical protein
MPLLALRVERPIVTSMDEGIVIGSDLCRSPTRHVRVCVSCAQEE